MLYIARAPFVSGAERALASVLRHLDRTLVEPHLILGCDTDMVSIAADMNVPTTIIPLPQRSKRNLFGWWRSNRSIKRVIQQFQPDVMHANDVPSCQAMSVLGKSLGIPCVIHVRWVIEAAAMGWWARSGTESVICISQWVRDQIGNVSGTTLTDSEFVIMPDAVDWPADHPNEVIATDLESNRDITLGFSGQLIESKGLDLVIEAMGNLEPNERPRLLVAGEDTQTGGAYQTELIMLAESCNVQDNLEWLGFLDDVSELHRRVDAMVCPSRVEPLGLVPLEAARFHLPAIASRVGGLAETIQHEKTGFLCEPTVDGWTLGLRSACSKSELTTWGHAAHARTVEHYAPAIYQDRLMAIYHNAIQRAAKTPR